MGIDGAAIEKERFRVHRGEPGCHQVTPLREGNPILENPPVPSLSSSQDQKANFRFDFLMALQGRMLQFSELKKGKVIDQFLREYNSGFLLQEIFKVLGKKSRPTIYRYIEAYQEGGIEALASERPGPKASKILPEEEEFLLKFLLHPNKPKISDAIRECKKRLDCSISAPSALRRFVNQWKIKNNGIWILKREGEKAWNDKCAPYQDRDPMLLEFGEALVADGHRMNLLVKDPLSGKPKRPDLIVFWDWKSDLFVGWEIAFSENVQSITVALFMALLKIGKLPSLIFVDNGKAFLSKIFTRGITIEETHIPSMIERLNKLEPNRIDKIEYRRAPAYHAQSKPIERRFLELNNRLERKFPSYVGSSIPDKPAYLLPNEPLAKASHDNWIPTVSELNQIIYQWVDDCSNEPLPKRQGLTSKQIFEEGKGPGIDPKQLFFLMMDVKPAFVRRGRFRFAGIDWESPCLYRYGGKILIRYCLSDFSQIYVFDTKDNYMGTATQCDKANAIKDRQAAKRIMAIRRQIKREEKKEADRLLNGGHALFLPEFIEAEDRKKQKVLSFKPFSSEAEGSKSELQNKAPSVIVDPETGLNRWADAPLPETDTEAYEEYVKMVKMGFNLNASTWGKIEEFERSDKWKQYFGKNPISKNLSKGAQDEGEFCIHQISQTFI
jgi:putative transposase